MSDNKTFECSYLHINYEEPSCTQFFCGENIEVLRIDKDGFVFKGERINDAGEAHKAFIEAMRILQGGE